jgi:two-component system NarL family sensor kinase
MYQKDEIYFVTIIGIILGLLLVSFIVAMLVLYKRRQQRQEQEMIIIKTSHEKEVLSSQLEIQENTFQTISQELHDNIGQMVQVVKLSLDSLPLEKDHPAYSLIRHCHSVLGKAINDIRGIASSLYTDHIIQNGLTESIRSELNAVKNAGLLKTKFSVTGEAIELPEQKAIYLFRIFQESLNNVLKHSRATYIIVDLMYHPDNTFVMEIADNGTGFDTGGKQPPFLSLKGVGLKSMFNRSKMIGADINIISGIDEGTRILITLTPQKELYDKVK